MWLKGSIKIGREISFNRSQTKIVYVGLRFEKIPNIDFSDGLYHFSCENTQNFKFDYIFRLSLRQMLGNVNKYLFEFAVGEENGQWKLTKSIELWAGAGWDLGVC